MGKKNIIFLANGLGMQDKDSYDLGDGLTPNLVTLSQEYLYTTLIAKGKVVGFTPNQFSTFRTGWISFSQGEYKDPSVEKMSQKVLDKTFICENMEKSIEFASKNNSKMHVFFMIGDKFAYSTGDHLREFLNKCQEMKVKEVCVHLFIGYNSKKDMKVAKDYIKAINRCLTDFENAHLSLIVGYDLVSDSAQVTSLTKLYKICTTSVSETWTDWQTLFDQRYKNGIPDEKITPFLVRRRVLFENNDSIFIFNYEPMPITRYLSIIIKPQQVFTTDDCPSNIKITSLFPIQENTTLAHCYEYDLPDNYFTKKLQEMDHKVTLISDNTRAGIINVILNGNRKELNPYLQTKSLKINNDYFAEMTQVLLNEIETGTNDTIIIDYDLMHGYKDSDLDTLRNNFTQADKAIRKVYEYVHKNGHRMIISSLYGINEQAIVEDTKVNLIFSEKVPIVVVDNEYTKNTAFIQTEGINLISQTLFYILGDKKVKTLMILRGKKSGLTKVIIGLIAILYLAAMIFLFVL